MRVTITGNKGFIGSALVKALDDFTIDGVDLENNESIFDQNIEERIKKSDLVYHLAALTNVNESFKNPYNVFETNVLGTARILYLCAKYEKKLIYPSSAAVYHPELSPYAHSKWLAEELVKQATKRIPIVILRLFNVYGDNMRKDSGSIMYNFIHDANLIVYGDGEQTRDYINIKDVVAIMRDAMHETWNGFTVDVGSGQAYSVNYIAELFQAATGKEIIHVKPKQEIKWSTADTTILRQLYKEDLITNLSEDIEKLYKHEKS